MKFELEQFNRDVADEDLLTDLIAAYLQLKLAGKALTFRSYRDVGKYAPATIAKRFGTWNDALQRAGVDLNEEKNVSVEALFDNLKIVWIAKGRRPVFRDMNRAPSQYAASTYDARFGGWRNALQAFVEAFNHEQVELTPSVVQDKTAPAARTNRAPSLSLRFFVLKRDNFRCTACGRSPATTAGLELEIDHIHAWSRDGGTVAENLQALCFECNRGKSAT